MEWTMNTLTTITEANPCFLCVFCKSGEVDDLNLGQLFMFEGVVTHYFCMLFSAALSQNGRDDEGILGFLPNDIMTEVRRSFRLRCLYCGTVGASVGCCNKRCRTAFHYPCGLRNGANYQFFGNYESYCSEHIKIKDICISQREWSCPICTSKVVSRQEAIQSSCCKSAIFHKECLQKLALSSGYFFKCPLCNNGKEFVHEMRSLGIFVPEQDASWEREPNAYEDLYYQHSQCDVETCECPKGRSYSSQKGSWILARCRICGAFGTHKHCSKLATIENWACEPCLVVELRTEKEKAERQQALIKEGLLIQPSTSKPTDSNTSSDEAEQEAYVSARSGNRKVRNGRLQKRSHGKKHWRISDLEISPWCFWYFPYTKQTLSHFNAKSTLPDWRNLTLKVNLVNWIPKSLFEDSQEDSEDQKVTIEGITEEDRALISDSEIVTAPEVKKRIKTVKLKKKAPKKSKWSSGVIKRQKSNKRFLEWKRNKEQSAVKSNGLHQSPGKWDVENPNEALPSSLDSVSDPHPQTGNSIEVGELLPVITGDEFQLNIQCIVEIPMNEKQDLAENVDPPLLDPSTSEVSEISGNLHVENRPLATDELKPETTTTSPIQDENEKPSSPIPESMSVGNNENESPVVRSHGNEKEPMRRDIMEEPFQSYDGSESLPLSPTKVSVLTAQNLRSPAKTEIRDDVQNNSDEGYLHVRLDHPYSMSWDENLISTIPLAVIARSTVCIPSES